MNNVYKADLTNFLKDPSSCTEECKKVVESFRKTGILFVKDPRVKQEFNDKFMDMMEKYYNQSTEEKKKDSRPQYSYQIGSTPEGCETPRDHSKHFENFSKENAPHKPTGADAKWRYFWRAGERPKNTKFPTLNVENVVPEGFPEWKETMDKWATLMLNAVSGVSQMLSVGYGFDKDKLTNMMNCGPHLLAPTGSDLNKYTTLGTILAGVHTDLNFITIHGKSRYPGLYVWLRDGTKVPVKVPEGYLLCQAGKQLEYVTGGDIMAGFHEVVISEDTLKAVEKAKKENRILWRVSSTLFSHMASDVTLEPLEHLKNKENEKKYPKILAGDQVIEELKVIKLQSS